jgi:hypothetical protein
MLKAFLAMLAVSLLGCLPRTESGSSVRSITGAEFKGKKYYFAFNGGDTGSLSPTVFEPMFDAHNLGAVFSRSNGGNYSTDITYDTTRVTGEFLMAKLDEYAAKLGPDDMFIMYTGSHGSRDGLYLRGETIPYEKIVEKVMKFRAKEVLIFMMACHSGAFSDAITTRHSEYAQWSRSGRTLFVLASSQANQTSSTFPSPQQEGVYKDSLNVPGNTGTAYGNVLWRAIRGDADANADKKVTLKETYDYVVRNTEQLAGHRPAFAGDFPHDLVLTLAEGAETAVPVVASESIDALMTKISELDKKIDALMIRLADLNLLVSSEMDSTPLTSDVEAGSDEATGTLKLVDQQQPVAGGDAIAFAVVQVQTETRKPAATAAEVQNKGGKIGQTLASLSAVIADAISRLNESTAKIQLQALNTELSSLREQYDQAVEELRIKVAENLAGRQ